MQQKSRSKLRRIEVVTGLIIILIGFGFVIALLMDFNIGSPHSTLQEDLVYLSDYSLNQKISAWAWLSTSIITLIAVPFYLLAFHNRLKVLHIVNGILMLGAAGGALMTGLEGLELNQVLALNIGDGLAQADEQVKLGILEHLRDEQFYKGIGGSCAALFAFGLSLTKFKMARFPMVSSVLLMVSGPALIFFNWQNPEHLLRTAAMAGVLIGMIIFCVRLINKGM